MEIGMRIAEADGILDYVPILSAVTNIACLILKFIDRYSSQSLESRGWTYIRDKSTWRCVIAIFVPIIGNLYIFQKDYIDYRVQIGVRDSKRDQSLADQASNLTGKPVALKEMGPAPNQYQINVYKCCLSANAAEDYEKQKALEAIDTCVKQGLSLNFFHHGVSPLVAASQNGAVELVTSLINNGANPNQEDLFGMTPLTAACTNGNKEVVNMLISKVQNGANALNGQRRSPLSYAIEYQNTNVVFLLLKNEVQINLGIPGDNVIMWAIYYCKENMDILNLLIKNIKNIDKYVCKVEINAVPVQLSLILYACHVDNLKAVDVLLQLDNVNIEECDPFDNILLHYSVKDAELTQKILDRCKKDKFVNQKNNLLQTPLDIAILKGYTQAALKLIEKGANPYIDNLGLKTSYEMAKELNRMEIVNAINKKFNIDLRYQIKIEEKSLCHEDAAFLEGDVLIKNDQDEETQFENRKFELAPPLRTGMEILFGRIG